MIEQKLKKLGFGKNEIKVYLCLLELGQTHAKKIIEVTALHPNLVYTSLDSLLKRKLATKTETNGVASFSINSPEHILEEIEAQKHLAEEAVVELKKRQGEKPREIIFYEGLEGIKRATRQNLQAQKGQTVYLLGASKHAILPDLSMRWRNYHNARIKKGIKFKALYGPGTEKQVIEEKNKLPLTEVKYSPVSVDAPVWFNVCEDVSSIVLVDKNPIAINIKSKSIADGLKKYFEYLWLLGVK